MGDRGPGVAAGCFMNKHSVTSTDPETEKIYQKKDIPKVPAVTNIEITVAEVAELEKFRILSEEYYAKMKEIKPTVKLLLSDKK